MNSFRPDISQLFNALFIGAYPVYKLPEDKERLAIAPFKVDGVKEYKGDRVGAFGLPIIAPVTFLGGSYNRFENDGSLRRYSFSNFELPASTMVEFSRSKNIIETQVAGGDGTIKELFSFADWQIRIRGVCLDDPSHPQYPTAVQQREALEAWENIAGAIEVEGALFAAKSIFSIVIKDFSIASIQGSHGLIPFEISCASDVPLELML